MNNSFIKKLLLDPRFIILLFFILRLISIGQPPLEANNNWRQVTTNMYARNFLEIDNNILYARVDMAGELTGITAKEFPIFNYLIYITAEIFGWEHWYGRLISLVFSSFGIWFFYRLVQEYISEEWSFSAMLILLASIWMGHSRIIMPDTFAVSLVLGGLYFAMHFLEKGGNWRWTLFFVLATLGALSKLPAGFLLSVLTIPIFVKSYSFNRKLAIVVAGAILLAICGWWYFKWLPYLVQTYGYEHYPMRSFLTGATEMFQDIPKTLERFYRSALKSYIAFGFYFLGLVFLFWKKPKKLLFPFLLLSFVFFLYMCKAGSSFNHHNYYIIPFVPVMAIVAAYGLQQISKPWLRQLILLVILLEGFINQQDAFHIKHKQLYKLELESIADSLSHSTDLVAFNTANGNPQELYFSHRKGWVAANEQLTEMAYRDELKSKGCRFIFINKKIWAGESIAEELVFENESYWVYKL